MYSEKEYVDALGLGCPNCYLTEGVEANDAVEVDDGIAWQNISCSMCDAEWVDNYHLVGYSELELMDNVQR